LSTVDDYVFLNEKEFNDLTDKQRWEFITSLKKAIKDLQIMAEKNCSQCEQYHLAPEDLNINFMFEDWRTCAENCENCGKEERVNMCNLQFELMNHLAEEFNNLRNKFNGMVKYLLKKDEEGREFVRSLKRDIEASKGSSQSIYG